MSFVGAQRESLQRYFAEHQPHVLVAYLFGSRAKGTSRPDSDWDFAVVPAPRARLGSFWLPRLVVDLGSLVASNRVDVAVLDRAAPALQIAVVRDGIVLHERAPGEAIRFRVRAVAEYLDAEPLRKAREELFRRTGASSG